MPVTENHPPFVGRSAELATLRAELRTVRTGVPRVVLVEGDAGIGKTALIEQPRRGVRLHGAARDRRAVGGLRRLRRDRPDHAGAGVSTARLLASRARAFPAEEPVGVGAWLLDVLTDLEQKSPVAVVVDDAHWADMDSLRSLLFAVRRLVGERVLLVLGHRAEDAPRLLDGLRRLAGGRNGFTLRLQSLPATDIHQLAGALGIRDFSVRAAQRLHAHTEGNAFFVKTMLPELPEQHWHTWDLSLPAPRAFADQVQRKLEACQPSTRGLMEAMAG